MRDAELAATVERFQLGTGAVWSSEPVARGEQGEVWRLETDAGTWAVKELFTPQREADVRPSADFQDAAHAAGVPSPRTVRTVDGDVLVDLDGVAVRVYTWVDLHEADPDIDPVAVGQAVAAIHRLAWASTEDQHWWYVQPVGAARWDELVAALTAAGAPFADDLASLRDELVALESLIEPATQLQICHLDLWADNVRDTPGGGVCVIDWDNCGPGAATRELALVLYEFAYDDLRRARLLHDAYVEAGGPGRVTRRSDFSMLIAQLGHILEMACSRWLDPNAPTDRSHNEWRVAECIGRPLTRTVIDALVGEVTI